VIPATAIRVNVSAGELFFCQLVGAGRDMVNAIEKRMDAKGKRPGYDPVAGLVGCVGEYATAKAFNLNWSSMFDRGAVDVGGVIEVRASEKSPRWLGVYSTDKDRLPYVCADCSPIFTVAPHVWLLGWILGADGKKVAPSNPFGNGRPPQHWIPVGDLHPCHKLKPELLDRFK
jgi:hypothetical protein